MINQKILKEEKGVYKKLSVKIMNKYNKYKEIIINILLLIAIVLFSLSIVKSNIYPTIKCEKELTKINDIDKSYDFLYYDENIRPEAKEIYPEVLNRYDFIIDELKQNNIKILITNKNIRDKYKELTSLDNLEINDAVVGLFIKKLKLILIKDVDSLSTNTIPMEYVKNSISNELKERYKGKDNILLKDFFSDTIVVDEFTETLVKELTTNKTSTKINIGDIVSLSDLGLMTEYEINQNGSTLLHELGHFMNSISNKKLLEDKGFIETYNSEKDEIFNNSDYFKSNESEFLAQCISNYLLYGNVSWNDNKYKTTEYIKNLINEFK